MVSGKGRAYGRVGLLGNPSDMYGGKCISFTFDRSAEVEIRDSKALRISGNGTIESKLEYNGNSDLVKATLNFLKVGQKELDVSYRSNIPKGYGFGGSSAIVIATIRALDERFPFVLGRTEGANRESQIAEIATYIEVEELKIAAGFQDRYIISHEGVGFMDFFGKEFMRKNIDRYGEFKRMDVKSLPCFLVLSGRPKSSAKVHNSVRQRFLDGDVRIKDQMDRIADLAEEGAGYLSKGDWEKVGMLMNRNHRLRKAYGMNREEDNKVVADALIEGAFGAKTAGSGGGIVVLIDEEDRKKVFDKMKKKYGKEKVFKTKIVGGSE